MILRKCILCVFLAALSIHTLKADDDPCHIYGGAMGIAVFRSTLVYDISKNGTITPPYVDSVWVTPADTSDVLMVTYAQNHEKIDISCLDRGIYVLFIRIGDCVIGRMFYYRGYATDVLETKTKPFVRKYIHNGKLLIKCDDKTYTVIGQEVK